jgi:hypothetical protein
MSNKTTDIFCTILVDFLNDINKSYPDASLYLLIKTTEVMISATPNLVIENFMICMEPYISQIKAKDASFFLNGGISNKLEGTQYSFLIDEINKVCAIWSASDTPIKTKESIWKYFDILTTLGLKLKN